MLNIINRFIARSCNIIVNNKPSKRKQLDWALKLVTKSLNKKIINKNFVANKEVVQLQNKIRFK